MATTAEIRALFDQYGVNIGTATETEAERLRRIADQVNSGERTLESVESSISRISSGEITFNPEAASVYGGGSAAPSSRTGDNVWTSAEVAALFREYGATVETPGETEAERLQRIAQQLNSGTRTEAEVREAIRRTTLEGFQYDPSASLQYGGQGAGDLQAVTGGNGQIWYDRTADLWYMAYPVPGTDVPLLYDLSPSDLNALFPQGNIRADVTLTSQEILQRGALLGVGDAADILNANPYYALLTQLDAEADVRPWLREPDVLALITEAAIEGRQVSLAELQQTRWWSTQNETQRMWATLMESDPQTAQQMLEAATIDTRSVLEQFGSASPPPDITRWLAQKVISGEWSQEKYLQQVKALADPYSGIRLDPSLARVVGGRQLDTATRERENVRSLVQQYLGPVHGAWSDSQLASWAGRFRNDPDARDELVQMLRQQRLALFPEYENPNLTYEDIAGPWRGVVQQVWGQQADETDPLFSQLVRINDLNEATKLLRQEGLARDIGAVKDDLISTIGSIDIGEQVRPTRG